MPNNVLIKVSCKCSRHGSTELPAAFPGYLALPIVKGLIHPIRMHVCQLVDWAVAERVYFAIGNLLSLKAGHFDYSSNLACLCKCP